MKKLFVALIILIFPAVVSSHGVSVYFPARAGILPGSWKYAFDRMGEWVDVNLLTVSTKKKQDKKLKNTDERVAEIIALTIQAGTSLDDLDLVLRRYEAGLRDAQDMAEKIIILDGAEISVGEKFEKSSRVQEQVLLEAYETAVEEQRGLLLEALHTAMLENEDMFRFMVTYYQQNDEDIRRYQAIVGDHMRIIQARYQVGANAQVDTDLSEARKFLNAGLSIRAYEFIKDAKNRVY